MGKVFVYVTPDGVEHKINYTELNLDDSVVSGTKGWSSGKIKDELDKKATVVQLNTKADSSTVSALTVRMGNNESAITALQTLTSGDHSTLNSHVNNKSNPHGVTKAQVGLDKVENTALSSWQGTANLSKCNKGNFGNACTATFSFDSSTSTLTITSGDSQ